MSRGEGNGPGRPLKYETVEELDDAIEKYFLDEKILALDKERNPIYTMTGLAVALGIDRKTLLSYSYKDEYLPSVKKAKSRVEQQMEYNMLSGSGSTTGYIFSFKNNFDWNDKTETEIYGKDGGPIHTQEINMPSDPITAAREYDRIIRGKKPD